MKNKLWLILFTLILLIPIASAFTYTKNYYKFDELSSNVSIDVNLSINGSYIPTATQTNNSKINGAWNFTGANGGFIANLSQDTSRTYNYWINPNGYGNGCPLCIDNSGATGRSILWQVASSTSQTITFWDTLNNPQTAFSVANMSMPLRTWTMITLVIVDNSYTELYQNGVLIKRTSIAYAVQKNVAEMTALGNRWRTGAMDLNLSASFDEFTYSNTAWSSADIQYVYNAGAGRYPFNTTQITNATFQAVNGYNGTTINSFCVTNGSLWGCTTTGTANITGLLTNASTLQTIRYESNESGGYFNETYTSVNVSSVVNKTMAQSVISFIGLAKVSGLTVTNTNFTTPYLSNITHYMAAGTYNVTASRSGYFNTTQNYTAVALSNTTAYITNLSSTLYNISLQNNLTNASISNFGYTIVSNTYAWNESGTASGTNAYIYLINGSYNITFNVSGFTTTTFNVTISSGGTINQTFRVYPENSIYFYFFNASTLLPVTTQNITVALSQGTTIVSNSTNASGSLFMQNITPGNYSLQVSTNNFNLYRAFVTIGNNSFQTFNVYLVPSTSSNNAVFTVVNIQTAAAIEGAVASIETQPSINSSYIFIGAYATDVTGAFNLNYVQNQNYRITISANGYVTKAFNLTPIISTTYQIQLTPTEPINVTDDYQSVQVQVLPNAAYSGQQFNFSYYIAAPEGNLQLFNYTVTTNYNASIVLTGSSNNAQGGILNNSFLLINTTIPNASVIIKYEYTLSNGARFYFTRVLPISPAALPSSATNLGDGGLSLWDRILISVIVTIFFAGIITWFSNEAFGGVIAIGCFGYFIMTAFLPLWAGVISIVVLFIFVAGVTAR